MATATAVGLVVDGARMPFYLATQFSDKVNVISPLEKLAITDARPSSHSARRTRRGRQSVRVFRAFKAGGDVVPDTC